MCILCSYVRDDISEVHCLDILGLRDVKVSDSRQVTMIPLFFRQTHWSSAECAIPATVPITRCESKHKVTQGDIHTYVALRFLDRLFQKRQLPLLG